VSVARQKLGDDAVVVLAWAGSAAQLVGGQTVSSLLRVSVGDVCKERILSRILANPEAKKAITAAWLVVIDEAPTIPGRWFDRLEYVFRRTALPTMQCRPFGGRTVFGTCSLLFYPKLATRFCVDANCIVFIDDGCMPVDSPYVSLYFVFGPFILAAAGDPLQLPAFKVTDTSAQKGAYSERAWDDSFFSTYGDVVELVGQHRQAWGDPLLSILSRLRVGDCREEDLALLNSTWADEADEWPDFQHLRAKICDAKAYNNKRLAELVGARGTFTCRDEVMQSEGGQRRDGEALRLDALNGAVGSRGAGDSQDLSQVAADTVTVKVGARVVCTMSFGGVKTGAHGIVTSFVSEVSVCCKFEGVEEPLCMPFVKFFVMDAEERELACRWQVPILLSWAVTVSRSQGMTILKVAVDFSCTQWTLDGLVYAALSRAVSLASLRVRGLTKEHVKTSANALAWYERVRAERLFRAG